MMNLKKLLQIIFPVLVLGYMVWLSIYMTLVYKDSFFGANQDAEPTINVLEVNANEISRNELLKKINTIISEKEGEWSVYVKNLDSGMELEINNRAIKAASLIKLFNMVTLYNEADNGNVILNESLRKSLDLMITVSSNSNSNKVVTTIGGGDFNRGAAKVTELAKKIGCENTVEEHMLYDTYVNTAGANTTSLKDCALILEKIYNQKCISPQYDQEMLELLKEQTLDWKLPQGLPEGTEIAHKTGENSSVEADVGIVFSPECDYIICVGVTDYGTVKPRQTIADVSECVYNYFNNSLSE